MTRTHRDEPLWVELATCSVIAITAIAIAILYSL